MLKNLPFLARELYALWVATTEAAAETLETAVAEAEARVTEAETRARGTAQR